MSKKSQNPIGLFIQGQGLSGSEYSQTLDHIERANYKTLSVMNNFQLCIDIKNRLPECVVVHRDSNFEPRPSANNAKVITDYLGTLPQDKRIIVMVNCEQGFDAERVKMWCEMIVAAEAIGWHLAVGGMSSGSVKCGQGSDPNEWLTTGAPLLKTLMEHPGSFLHSHNYSGPFLWVVSNGGWGDPLKPPEKIDWSLPQWHLGRECQGIMAAVKALHYEALLEREFYIISEGFIDEMNDLKDEKAHPDYPYRNVFSNRWRYLIPKWAEWYKNPDGQPRDAEDVLADQNEWAWEKIYAPLRFIVGVHIFTFRDVDANHLWDSDRVDNAMTYRKRMEDYVPPGQTVDEPPKAPVLQPKPVNMSKKLTVRALNNMNVRYGPSMVDMKLNQNTNQAEVLAGNFVRLWGKADVPATDWTWVYCQIVTGNFALAEGWLYYPELQYSTASTKEIPVIKPPPEVQSHTLTVKVSAAAPYGDLLAKWVEGQIQGAGDLFKSLNLDETAIFSVEEVQS